MIQSEKNLQLHQGRRDRVRKRYIDSGGLDDFADHEVLELLLYYSHPRGDTNEIAHKYIKEFGSLSNLFEADPKDIENRLGTSQSVAVLISMIPHISKRYMKSKWQEKPKLDTTDNIGQYAKTLFVGEKYERFYIICLDNKYSLLGYHLVGQGTIDTVSVHQRTLVEIALRYNAVHVVLVHNHPSGELRASADDIKITKKIKKTMDIIDITVIDHIIVGNDDYYSFYKNNLIN